MDAFALRDAVDDEYKKFATAFTTIHGKDITKRIDAIDLGLLNGFSAQSHRGPEASEDRHDNE